MFHLPDRPSGPHSSHTPNGTYGTPTKFRRFRSQYLRLHTTHPDLNPALLTGTLTFDPTRKATLEGRIRTLRAHSRRQHFNPTLTHRALRRRVEVLPDNRDLLDSVPHSGPRYTLPTLLLNRSEDLRSIAQGGLNQMHVRMSIGNGVRVASEGPNHGPSRILGTAARDVGDDLANSLSLLFGVSSPLLATLLAQWFQLDIGLLFIWAKQFLVPTYIPA